MQLWGSWNRNRFSVGLHLRGRRAGWQGWKSPLGNGWISLNVPISTRFTRVFKPKIHPSKGYNGHPTLVGNWTWILIWKVVSFEMLYHVEKLIRSNSPTRSMTTESEAALAMPKIVMVSAFAADESTMKKENNAWKTSSVSTGVVKYTQLETLVNNQPPQFKPSSQTFQPEAVSNHKARKKTSMLSGSIQILFTSSCNTYTSIGSREGRFQMSHDPIGPAQASIKKTSLFRFLVCPSWLFFSWFSCVLVSLWLPFRYALTVKIDLVGGLSHAWIAREDAKTLVVTSDHAIAIPTLLTWWWIGEFNYGSSVLRGSMSNNKCIAKQRPDEVFPDPSLELIKRNDLIRMHG